MAEIAEVAKDIRKRIYQIAHFAGGGIWELLSPWQISSVYYILTVY